MLDSSVILKVEETFGFQCYDWQRRYFQDQDFEKPTKRASGRTWAYCIKLLLDHNTIKIHQKSDLRVYVDGYYSLRYPIWFIDYLLEINQKLVDAGFQTSIVWIK